MLDCEVSENFHWSCWFQSRFLCQHSFKIFTYALAFWGFLDVFPAIIYINQFLPNFSIWLLLLSWILRLVQKLDRWFATQVWLNGFSVGCREAGTVGFYGSLELNGLLVLNFFIIINLFTLIISKANQS